MPSEITIIGNLVQVHERNLVREARLEDFLPFVENRPPITIGKLPKTAVLVRWDESDARYRHVKMLVELAPGVRECRYAGRRYTLSIPWTYFLFEYRTTGNPNQSNTPWELRQNRIFWARQEVLDLDSQLATALVPNCDETGTICYGNTGVDASLPLNVRVDRTVSEFYHTTFMHDSGTGSPWQSETGSHTWARWHRESVADPAAWTKFPEWESTTARRNEGRITYQTVREVFDAHMERPSVINVVGTIPDLPMPFTFGRAEEWLTTQVTDPGNRHRLLVALQNVQADEPTAVAPPPEVNEVDDDLGGEPIEE